MTLAFAGVSHWLEPSVVWLRGSKEIPTALCSTPLYGDPWAIAVPVLFTSRDCSIGRIAACCVFTLGYDVDGTTLSWKSFLLVAHKAFSLVTSAIMSASHSKHRTQEWNAVPAMWLLLDDVNMGFPLELDLLELDNWAQNQSRCIWVLPCALLVGTLGPHHPSADSCVAMLLGGGFWAQQNWSGCLERVIPSCPFPQKWGEVKDSILQNAYFPMVVHIFDVLPSW